MERVAETEADRVEAETEGDNNFEAKSRAGRADKTRLQISLADNLCYTFLPPE